MTFDTAIGRLLQGDESEEVWRAVMDGLVRFGQRGGVIPQYRDDSVAFANQRVVEMLDDGRLASVENPTFFFYSVIRNRSISLWRKDRPAPGRPPAPGPTPPEPTLSIPRLCAIIAELKESAVQIRPEPHRAEVAASIDRMLQMALEGLRTRDVIDAVAREEQVVLETEKDRERFVNVLDRRHSRARGYLLQVISRKRRTPDAEEEARGAVRLLRRRQENRRPASAHREPQ